MLAKGMVILHENARPPIAGQIHNLLDSFGLEVLNRPPYSPGLVPNDYHLFLHLRKHPIGNRNDDDDDVKTAVNPWLLEQAASLYEEGVLKLVGR